MQETPVQRTHLNRANFDLSVETVIRKIMLRRLLALRGAPKPEKNEEEVKTTAAENEKNNNDTIINVSSENEEKVKEETPIKDEILLEPKVDNNKLIQDEIKTEQEEEEEKEENAEESLKTNEVDNTDSNPEEPANEDEEEGEEKTIEIDDSEVEKEKNDEEIEINEEANESKESLIESEIELNPESYKSEGLSDAEGKDSGIEKGDSPTLPTKETTDEEDVGTLTEPGSDNELNPQPIQPSTVPDMRTSSFVGPTTVNVLSPENTKQKRFVKRTKSARRHDIDLDSELSCDSSPEKRLRRKNMTVSYLSYPQRFVRSSLAVEARLSQWRKESSVVENSRVEMPNRNGILKQRSTSQDNSRATPQRTNSARLLKGRPAPRDVSFRRSRHSDSDTSSDDEGRMSVRKIYSSKSALRRRIENLEGMLLTLATQKAGLEELMVTMEMWSLELSHVDRTKLGVPYIRSVKDVLKKQRHSMTSKKSNFNQLIYRLQEAKVPCFDQVNKIVKQLNKEVTSIVQDRQRYSSRHIEDIRQLQGNIIGTCMAVTAVFYEE